MRLITKIVLVHWSGLIASWWPHIFRSFPSAAGIVLECLRLWGGLCSVEQKEAWAAPGQSSFPVRLSLRSHFWFFSYVMNSWFPYWLTKVKQTFCLLSVGNAGPPPLGCQGFSAFDLITLILSLSSSNHTIQASAIVCLPDFDLSTHILIPQTWNIFLPLNISPSKTKSYWKKKG